MTRLAVSLLAGVAALGFISSVQAADLIISEPAPPVGVIDVGGNWDGVYVGAFAGYGWGTVTDEDGLVGLVADTEYDLTGWQVGVAAGANFTVSEAIVAGIVADIAWTDLSGDSAADDFSYDVNWLGSVRGRLGFDGGAFLPYLTAGVAFANATASEPVLATEDTQTHIGWTVGAGVEFAVADNVSLDLLYRYSDYGSKDYDLTTDPTPLSLTAHTISAGVNFKF
jgi:outer membrane immunogenic protein